MDFADTDSWPSGSSLADLQGRTFRCTQDSGFLLVKSLVHDELTRVAGLHLNNELFVWSLICLQGVVKCDVWTDSPSAPLKPPEWRQDLRDPRRDGRGVTGEVNQGDWTPLAHGNKALHHRFRIVHLNQKFFLLNSHPQGSALLDQTSAPVTACSPGRAPRGRPTTRRPTGCRSR